MPSATTPNFSTASGLPRSSIVLAADSVGCATVSCRQLGKRAGVAWSTAAAWLRGERVAYESDLRLRRALGLPAPMADAA